MPVYNAEKYVEAAIRSILRQTFKMYELIIIDDHSTDDSWGIIQRLAREDKRVRAMRNPKNLYIAANRNKLIKQAKGKYIAWQDADDISLPRRLEKQYIFLEKHPDVGIVGGFLEFFNEKGPTSVRKYAADDRTLRKQIFRFSPVAQPAAMIRSVCFKECGDYNLSYPPAEDIDMSFRIGIKYKFANLQEIVLQYRESSGSATYKKVKFILKTTLKIREKYWHEKAYSPTRIDRAYNILLLALLYLLPGRAIIFLFNIVRNSR